MRVYSIISARIETYFEILGRFLYSRSTVFLVVLLPCIVFLASQLFFIKINTSIEKYLKDQDPALIAYEHFQEQFGSDERVVVGINSEDIFSSTTLQRLSHLQKDIEKKVPHIGEVKSLLNASYMENRGDDLVLGVLGDFLPAGNEDNSDFLESISTSLYQKQFFSPDKKLAILSLPITCASYANDSLGVLAGFQENDPVQNENEELQLCSLDNKENGELITVLEQIKQRNQQGDFQIHLTGMPLLRQFMRNAMRVDSVKFIVLSIALCTVFLYLLFGRMSGVVFPLLIVFCSVTSTIGIMVLLEKPFKSPTIVLPSFLLAVGVGASVHILVLFYQFLSKGETRQEAIAKALGHSGLPVVLTALTTAAGLASFATAKVAPVADLGIFAAMGALFSLFYTILLLPALISLFPIRHKNRRLFINFSNPVERFLTIVAEIATAYPKGIVLFCVGLFLFSCLGISKIELIHNPLLWLPKKSELHQDTKAISDHFPGLVTVEVLIDTNVEQGMIQPEILQKLDKLEKRLGDFSTDKLFVFNVFSILDVVKQIHKKLVTNASDSSLLPSDSESIAQELLLLESSSPATLRQLLDTRFQTGRITIQAPWVDAMAYAPLLQYIEKHSQEIFKNTADITITGIIPLLAQTIAMAIASMVSSYLVAFLVISVAMVLLIGHFKLGLISMFPNLLPILTTLGYMGFAGIPLDMYTMLVGSIALGLVVDDTIHFMYNFRRYFSQNGDVLCSVTMTLHTAGKAMLITTIVLAGGSFIFMASQMNSLYYFGMLTGITIIMALLADFFLAPALMALYYKYNGEKS